MLIQYIHKSEPEKIKIHDTVKVWKNTFRGSRTQKEVDEITWEKVGKRIYDAYNQVLDRYKH